MRQLERQLIMASQGSNYVRTWGVIDDDKGTYSVKATCRRCGDHGEFPSGLGVEEFKQKHLGQNNKCPFAKDVTY